MKYTINYSMKIGTLPHILCILLSSASFQTLANEYGLSLRNSMKHMNCNIIFLLQLISFMLYACNLSPLLMLFNVYWCLHLHSAELWLSKWRSDFCLPYFLLYSYHNLNLRPCDPVLNRFSGIHSYTPPVGRQGTHPLYPWYLATVLILWYFEIFTRKYIWHSICAAVVSDKLEPDLLVSLDHCNWNGVWQVLCWSIQLPDWLLSTKHKLSSHKTKCTQPQPV